jgi:H+/gluconate symporter-like permease
MNTASEYGFGAVIASLPGFLVLADALRHPQPAGQRSDHRDPAGRHHRLGVGRHEHRPGGHGELHRRRHAANIPLEVLHRVAAMASGGMDTLPHNGAVITLLAVTGLTHREAYKDIFGITLIKTLAVFVVIATFYATGIV